MREWTLIYRLLCVSIMISAPVIAQEDKGNVIVVTNYEQFYVVIDGDFENPISVSNPNYLDSKKLKILKVEEGERFFTVIPPYSESYTFKLAVGSEVYHEIKIDFGIINEPLNQDYLKISSGEFVPKRNVETSSNLAYGSFKHSAFESEDDYRRGVVKSEESKKTAYLKVSTNVEKFYLKIGYPNFQIVPFQSGDSIKVEPGSTKITLGHPQSEEYETVINFAPNTTELITYNFELHQIDLQVLENNFATKPALNGNIVIVSDYNSSIYVNGKFYGQGSAALNLGAGISDIKISNPETGEYKFRKIISNKKIENAQIIDAYTRPEKSRIRKMAFVPGRAQFYKGENLKGTLIIGGFASSLVLAGSNLLQYRNELERFRAARTRYLNGQSPGESTTLGDDLADQHDIMRKHDRNFVLFSSLAIGLIGYSAFDAYFIEPKHGYRKKVPLDLKIGALPNLDNGIQPNFTLSYDF